MPLSTLLAAAALLAPPAPPSGVAPPQTTVTMTTTAATAEGAEILRRILVDSIDEAFDESGERAKLRLGQRQVQVHGLVTTLWASNQTVQHARAFHLPEVGLFFSLDTTMPVTRRAAADGAASDAPKGDDEWERARKAVRGQLSADGVLLHPLLAEPLESGEIDPAAIERLTDVVLRALARHAARVEGLTARDTITVALRLSGRNRMLFDETHDGTFSFGFAGGGEVDEPDDEDEPEEKLYSAFVLATGQEVPEQTLVLRVPLGALSGQAETPAATLRKSAQIHRY